PKAAGPAPMATMSSFSCNPCNFMGLIPPGSSSVEPKSYHNPTPRQTELIPTGPKPDLNISQTFATVEDSAPSCVWSHKGDKREPSTGVCLNGEASIFGRG